MQPIKTICLCTMLISFCMFSCTKDKEDNFSNTVISAKEFLPMQLGAVQLYRMDSILPAAFGVRLDTFYYLAKDSVTLQTLDATGDTIFFVSRFTTDTLKSQPWALATTYQVVYTKYTVDLIQADGRRFIKLATPVRDAYSWDGNQYFVGKTDPGSVSPNTMYFGWNYMYDSIGMPYQTKYNSYQQTAIVQEVDNVTDFDPNTYNSAKYAQEVYAKGEGLIYQNILFYIYQPPGSSAGYYDSRSFGIKLTKLQ